MKKLIKFLYVLMAAFTFCTCDDRAFEDDNVITSFDYSFKISEDNINVTKGLFNGFYEEKIPFILEIDNLHELDGQDYTITYDVLPNTFISNENKILNGQLIVKKGKINLSFLAKDLGEKIIIFSCSNGNDKYDKKLTIKFNVTVHSFDVIVEHLKSNEVLIPFAKEKYQDRGATLFKINTDGDYKNMGFELYIKPKNNDSKGKLIYGDKEIKFNEKIDPKAEMQFIYIPENFGKDKEEHFLSFQVVDKFGNIIERTLKYNVQQDVKFQANRIEPNEIVYPSSMAEYQSNGAFNLNFESKSELEYKLFFQLDNKDQKGKILYNQEAIELQKKISVSDSMNFIYIPTSFPKEKEEHILIITIIDNFNNEFIQKIKFKVESGIIMNVERLKPNDVVYPFANKDYQANGEFNFNFETKSDYKYKLSFRLENKNQKGKILNKLETIELNTSITPLKNMNLLYVPTSIEREEEEHILNVILSDDLGNEFVKKLTFKVKLGIIMNVERLKPNDVVYPFANKDYQANGEFNFNFETKSDYKYKLSFRLENKNQKGKILNKLETIELNTSITPLKNMNLLYVPTSIEREEEEHILNVILSDDLGNEFVKKLTFKVKLGIIMNVERLKPNDVVYPFAKKAYQTNGEFNFNFETKSEIEYKLFFKLDDSNQKGKILNNLQTIGLNTNIVPSKNMKLTYIPTSFVRDGDIHTLNIILRDSQGKELIKKLTFTVNLGIEFKIERLSMDKIIPIYQLKTLNGTISNGAEKYKGIGDTQITYFSKSDIHTNFEINSDNKLTGKIFYQMVNYNLPRVKLNLSEGNTIFNYSNSNLAETQLYTFNNTNTLNVALTFVELPNISYKKEITYPVYQIPLIENLTYENKEASYKNNSGERYRKYFYTSSFKVTIEREVNIAAAYTFGKSSVNKDLIRVGTIVRSSLPVSNQRINNSINYENSKTYFQSRTRRNKNLTIIFPEGSELMTQIIDTKGILNVKYGNVTFSTDGNFDRNWDAYTINGNNLGNYITLY